MTTTLTAQQSARVRASDAEREEVARLVQAAHGEGRLTLTETEERLAGIYAVRFRHELKQYTEDLPSAATRPGFPGRRGVGALRGPLAVHAALVVVLSTMLIIRWVASGVPYFWPAFPMFWLVASLVIHARIRGARWRYRGTPAG
jgi:hypothetical protein